MYSTRPTDDLQSTLLVSGVRILSSKSSTKSSHASILHPNLNRHHPAQCSVRNQTTTSASSRPGRPGWKSSQTFQAMSKTVPKVNPSSSRTEAQVALYNLYGPDLGCWICKCAILMRGSVSCMSNHVGRVAYDDVLGMASDVLWYMPSTVALTAVPVR